MKLKRYLEFIKETFSEYNKKVLDIWKLNNEDIEDMFIDFVDEGWLVTLEKGFKDKSGNFDSFKEKVYLNDFTNPAYWITLVSKSDTSSKDMSDIFKDSVKRLESFSGGELLGIFVNDWEYGYNNEQYDLDSIIVKGGFIDENDIIENSGSIFIVEKEEIEIDEEKFVEYYNIQLEDSEFEQLKKGLFVHVDLGTLASKLIKDDNWEKTITECDYYKGPINDFWDNYDSYYYSPDFISLIDYNLNKENLDLLIKAVIKETGGVDEVKRIIIDELNNKEVKDLDLEGLVDFFKSERFYNSLKHFTKDSEIYKEVNYVVSDWSSAAHADRNYKEMMDEFDNIVEKEFTYNRKFREERVYKSKWEDGKKVDYKQEMTIYEIEFQNEWIDNLDFSDIDGKSLYDIFYEYISNVGYYDFEPHFSDYGDFDYNKMNSEIKSLLTNFLK